jgi:hypothetical protein
MGPALRILLIIFLAWYVYRLLDRVVGPLLFGGPKQKNAAGGKKEKNFRKSTKQGDVTITDYGKTRKDIKTGEDDYIDYEEVE